MLAQRRIRPGDSSLHAAIRIGATLCSVNGSRRLSNPLLFLTANSQLRRIDGHQKELEFVSRTAACDFVQVLLRGKSACIA
jgi:hypothetical protein